MFQYNEKKMNREKHSCWQLIDWQEIPEITNKTNIYF